jgi:uncharacterized protein (UPF0333 family)
MNWLDFIQKKMPKKAQVSLEYLLILAGFFSIFALLLPSVSFATQSFNSAQDTILAKQISEKILEQSNVFFYLGDGSKKQFEFIPQNKINFKSKGTKIIVSSSQKSFEVETSFLQKIAEEDFLEKFFILIEKKDGKTIISINQNKQ